jgi:SagB-type dehydrogenase family enzyme
VPEPALNLSREILDRVERVHDYHDASKHTYDAVQAALANTSFDFAARPNPYRVFNGFPKVALPTSILDVAVPAIQLLADGLGAVPASQLQPPQNLKTLATWLYLADGITIEKGVGSRKFSLRSCPSSGALFPFEVYVAAFAVEGLEPGLYHFGVREFALRKLRDGATALSFLKRGRPDLEYLKTVPAALLVSTNYWRSAWRYRQRAYRYVLQDAGHLVQNLVVVGSGLGIQTHARLRMNDRTTRQLIGLPEDCDFGECECVQAMVVWADKATHATTKTSGAVAYPAPAPAPPPVWPASAGSTPAPAEAGETGVTELPRIPRAPLSSQVTPYGSILAVHQDCVAPGVALREIRPPLTELAPVPSALPKESVHDFSQPEELPGGPSLRRLLLTRRTPHDFLRQSIPRGQFWWINRLAFRGGSHFPVLPDGPHTGLVKPLWLLHDVTGMDSGLWHYAAAADRWGLLRRGDYRMEAQYLCLEQAACGNASAVCFMVSNLKALMAGAGPDAYRLAHLEAGVVSQRIHLAAHGLDLGCAGAGAFYDDELAKFLDLHQTGWQPLYAVAVGVPAPEPPPAPPRALQRPQRTW